MEKKITVNDLKHYLQEIKFLEQNKQQNTLMGEGPSRSVVSALLRYSNALDVLKTKSAGIIFQLAN